MREIRKKNPPLRKKPYKERNNINPRPKTQTKVIVRKVGEG
jgi:hypothetical protein